MKSPTLVFILLFTLNLLSAQDLTVSQDMVISANATYDEITITNGSTLTINNGAVVCANKNVVIVDGTLNLDGGSPTLKMGPDRTIKIRVRGRMFANNALITSKEVGPGKAWRGVGVEGPGNSNSSLRGGIELQGSTLENSRYGIGNYQLPFQGARTGGWVTCMNTSFRNNGRSIEGLQDGFTEPPSGDALIVIEGCDFTIDQAFLNFNMGFLGMATFWRNMGLDIQNCSFSIAPSIANNPVFTDKHGIYFLQSFGNVGGCSFDNLSIGLEIDNKDAPNIPTNGDFFVAENNFSKNTTGCIVRSDDIFIWTNNFMIDEKQIGLILKEST
ncbi:MAG: hypothetical protein AAF597_03950, partial [Bacteroidota bacterium]